MKTFITLVATVLAISSLSYSQAKDVAEYQPCRVSGLKIVQTDRLPARPMTRSVKTADGEKPITMMDGWRVLYLLLPAEPMLNLKFEELDATNWAQEKSWLIDFLRELAKDGSNQQEVLENSFGKIRSYTLRRKSLDGGVLSISELFNDTVTIS